MKIKVKAPFFDENGIHKKGEICEVKQFNPIYMELVTEKVTEEKKEKVEKAVKADPKKTTRTKKG